jgi:hypothetical protein
MEPWAALCDRGSPLSHLFGTLHIAALMDFCCTRGSVQQKILILVEHWSMYLVHHALPSVKSATHSETAELDY